MGNNSFNKPNSSSIVVMPFFEILLLLMPFYFLPTNIKSLPQLLLPHSLLYYAIVCSAALPYPAHMKHKTDKVLLTGWWLTKPNRASVSGLPFKTITLLEDKAMTLAGDFCNQISSSFCCTSQQSKHLSHWGQCAVTVRYEVHCMPFSVMRKKFLVQKRVGWKQLGAYFQT